jgi:7-cyano-7-deazaguanine synthase
VPNTNGRRAVVLLSGGIDSTTVLAVTRHEGFDAYALSVRYGQRHAIEVAAAARVAGQLGAAHHMVLDVDLRPVGGSALTGVETPVPHGRRVDTIAGDGMPATYVPARNTIFLSLALAWAETLGARDLFIGATGEDRIGYPDCRPEYLAAYARMASLGTRGGPVEVHAPLADLDKAGVIARGLALGVDYAATWTCYDPTGDRPCGVCDACTLRSAGFAALDRSDPVMTS